MIYVKKHIFSFVLIILLIFSFFETSDAQMDQIDEDEPIEGVGDRIEYSEATKEVKFLGNVIVTYQDMKISADKVIIYPESKDVYAAGNVVLYKGEDVFGADKIYYNFDTKKGTLIHGNFHTGKVFGEGEKLEKISEKELKALKGYFSTCDLNIPHYRIEAKKIKIYLEDKVVARNVIFYIGSIPVMYFPYYSYSLKENKPKVSIIPGHSKEWGYFVLTSWRYFFNERSKGWVHIDWRENLGIGLGIDYEYNTEKYGQGILKTYYTQERKRHLKEHAPAEKEKYRVRLEHRWDIDKNTEAFLEYHKYRDQNFIKDYFYTEYIKDPLPISHLSVTRIKDHYSLSFIMRKRVNHFRTITETLPELKYDINNYKLGNTRFYYTAQHRFNNFDKKEAITGEDTDAVRIHSDNQLSYPTRLVGYLDWVEFTPHIGHLETFYSKDINGADRDFFRGQWYTGYNLTTKVSRIYDIDRKFMGVEINKLRHLVIPLISYTYRHEPTAEFSKLGQFDEVDTFQKAKFYTFSLENKLQTKWLKEGTFDKEKIDLISLRSSVDLFPQIEGHQFSNITNSLKIQPSRWLEFDFTNSYNPYSGDFEIFNVRAKAEENKWKVEATSRYTQQTQTHEGIINTTYTLSPKWTLGVYERYEFQKNELVEQQYSLIRDLHCWTAEFVWNIQEAKTIWLVFTPKAFPDLPIEFVTSYHAPKIGSQFPED